MKHLEKHLSCQKTINLVHFYSNPAGLEVLIPPVISALRLAKFCSFVIRPNSKHSTSVYNNINAEVCFGSKNNLIAALKLIKFALAKREEIFHVFNIGPFFLFIIRLSGVKRLIYSIHGTIYWHNKFEQFLFKFLWKVAITRTNYIFTSNSIYSGEIFRTKISPNTRIELLYNFIDSRRFCQNPDVPLNSKLKKVIYSGRLAKDKGLLLWIEIAMEIHREFPEIVFEIYGIGSLRPILEERIRVGNASEFIFLKGYRRDIESAYQGADLLLFLSEYESFGNVVVESILCNIPVLATKIPSMKEIFYDFPEFLLETYPPTSDEIISKLKDIENLRQRTKIAAIKFRDRYSLDRHTEILTRLYESA